MFKKYSGVSFVYVLVHDELPYLKVGKANDVQERLASLDLGHSIFRSLSTSFMIWSESQALTFEKTLHFMFSEYRCESPLYVPENGKPEWFSDEINGLVQDFARTLALQKGYMEERLPVFEKSRKARKNHVRDVRVPHTPKGSVGLTVELIEGRYSWFKDYMSEYEINEIYDSI